MRILISLILCFWTLSAAALNQKSSWDDIFKTKDIRLEYNENLGRMKLNNACLTDTQVLSRMPFKYCNRLVREVWGENKDKWVNWVCKEWIVEHDWYPRTLYRDQCTRWVRYGAGMECKGWIKQPITVAKTIQVRVVEFSRNNMVNGFQKKFTFPDCP